MPALLFKSLLGALAVLLIAVLARSRNFYIAGLVPLFPTFALIAHAIVAHERGSAALRTTAIFGLWALLPYAAYLAVVALLAERLPLAATLAIATFAWIVLAGGVLWGWSIFNAATT